MGSGDTFGNGNDYSPEDNSLFSSSSIELASIPTFIPISDLPKKAASGIKHLDFGYEPSLRAMVEEAYLVGGDLERFYGSHPTETLVRSVIVEQEANTGLPFDQIFHTLYLSLCGFGSQNIISASDIDFTTYSKIAGHAGIERKLVGFQQQRESHEVDIIRELYGLPPLQ